LSPPGPVLCDPEPPEQIGAHTGRKEGSIETAHDIYMNESPEAGLEHGGSQQGPYAEGDRQLQDHKSEKGKKKEGRVNGTNGPSHQSNVELVENDPDEKA
jgi:hypothetical protein